MLEWMDDISNSGFIRYLSFLNTEFLLVTSPKALNTICNQQVYNFVKTPLIRALINKAAGTGVFYAEGEQHKVSDKTELTCLFLYLLIPLKHERHALQPAFSFRRIKSLYPLFWSKAVELRDTLDTHVLQLHKAADGSDRPSSIIDASSWFSRATLDLLGIAVFDYDFGSVQNPDHALFHSTASYHTAQRSQLAGPLRFFLNQLLPEFVTRHVPFLSYGDFQKSADPARTYFRSLLDKRREDVSAGKDFGQDLLTMMLKRGDFSDEDMVHQMMTMWFAG